MNSNTSILHTPADRRSFLALLTRTVGTSLMLAAPTIAFTKGIVMPQARLTVGQVMDIILKEIPGAPFKETVDTLKSGTREQKVTGIITTTFPTVEVIEKTIQAGANFIIVHEPSYYNHQDETKWLEQDEVYKQKRALLDKHKIAIWRFHDYWHSHRPDGVMMGFLTALNWEKYYNSGNSRLITLPATPLRDIVSHVKQKFDIPAVRIIGNPDQLCSRIALSPGAAGGKRQIEVLQQTKPDLLICGESSEWETVERVRDGLQFGQKTSLLILGHAVSEEPGMQWLVQWLQPKVQGIKVTHVPAQTPFTWM